jgi:basic membrane protein A and related proteins
VIYKGPITDNTGKVVIPAGTTMDQKDPRLEKMDYLVAGVVGSTQS